MDVIVYVETNFLMSVAMGREGRGDDLLAAVSASVRVAIPSGCYMEWFSAFEDEQKRRNWFRAELDITPARKFRMLLHTNPTRERGECLGTRAGASEDM